MENISETVMMCMIAIAAIQFTIIFTIIRSRTKKNNEDTNKKTLIEILNTSSEEDNTAEQLQLPYCCINKR